MHFPGCQWQINGPASARSQLSTSRVGPATPCSGGAVYARFGPGVCRLDPTLVLGSIQQVDAGKVRGRESDKVSGSFPRNTGRASTEAARLRSRPGQPAESVGPGLHALGLGGDRDAFLYVPARYRPDQPAPFVLTFHGAGGNASRGLYPLRDLADEVGLILLSPASRQQTWDVLRGGYGPDVAFIDQALAVAFSRCAVNPDLLAISGFSDGASYALSLGITNGDLFPTVMAFSPGFMAPRGQYGRPRIFISHGTGDQVLAIDRTSRTIVPQLEQAGYDVRYREFAGAHTVPPEIAREALGWYLAPAEGVRPGAV